MSLMVQILATLPLGKKVISVQILPLCMCGFFPQSKKMHCSLAELLLSLRLCQQTCLSVC